MKITIEFASLEELLAFNRAPFATEPAAPAKPAPEPMPTTAGDPAPAPAEAQTAEIPQPVAVGQERPANRRGRKPRDLGPVAVPDDPAVPAEAANEAPPVQSAPAAAAPTEADAKAALEAVFEKQGFQGAQTLLQHVGAQRLRDLPADQYPALIAKAKELLA